MSSREFVEWQIYLNAFGTREDRVDLSNATVGAALLSALTGKQQIIGELMPELKFGEIEDDTETDEEATDRLATKITHWFACMEKANGR